MSIAYLYRGVNETLYASSSNGLAPKKCGPFEHIFLADGTAMADGSATAGPSEQNAVYLHQMDLPGTETSGLSTTPHIERARHYALGGGQHSRGYVLKLDRARFSEYGVKECRVAATVYSPHEPLDNEIVLVAEDGGILPAGIVAETVLVELPNKRL